MVEENKNLEKEKENQEEKATSKSEKGAAKTEKSAAKAEKSEKAAAKSEKNMAKSEKAVGTKAEKPAEKGAEATAEKSAEKVKAAAKRKKEKKIVQNGIVHVKATFNNTIVTITDPNGNVLLWQSAGIQGFKGSRKSTSFAAQLASQAAAKAAVDFGMRTVDVIINGPGAGRESSVRALQATGLRVTSIKDITPIPHNGCRPPKKRRV